ncbi:hypothetical protein [Haliangium sp.]|uniref:hypothetical protein n=1 Tax=Haliangium sp. TaxID=2663208 RepID=UPI003D13DF36
MQFCPWYPLAAAAEHAPASPGIYQVRVEHGRLLEYPRGKSAMVHYGHAVDLRAAALALAAQHRNRGWLCRHALLGPDDLDPRERALGPERIFADLVAAFARRFGVPPTFPESLPSAD